MSKNNAEIINIANQIDNIYEKLRSRVMDWWWLDQGDAPLISVTLVKIEGKNIKVERSPKVSLLVALRTIRDSLRKISNLKSNDRLSIIHEITKDFLNIYESTMRIMDANDFIKKLEEITSTANRVLGNEAKTIQTDTYNLIMKIKDIFLTNPKEWDRKREVLQAEINSIRKKIEKLRSKVVSAEAVEKKVREEEGELLEEEA
nr:hypothetical protein [Candidatus Baldrarchaeota archaeon]